MKLACDNKQEKYSMLKLFKLKNKIRELIVK